MADDRQANVFLGLCLDFVSSCQGTLKKVGGVSWGSLVTHLSENYHIRGLLLIASLSLGHSYPIIVGSFALLAWETKFSNTNNFLKILLSGLKDQCKNNITFFL